MTAMKWLILLAYLMVMAFRLWLRRLNLDYLARHGHEVPRAFAECIDQELLKRTSQYTLANSRVALVESLFSSLFLLLFLFAALFAGLTLSGPDGAAEVVFKAPVVVQQGECLTIVLETR